MTTTRRSDDTLSRRLGSRMGVSTRLMIGAMVLSVLATAVAVSGQPNIQGLTPAMVISGLAGLSVALLIAAVLIQIILSRQLRTQILGPIDDMNSRLRKMIIAGVNDVRPLDTNAVSELKDVWANYQKLSAAVDRARSIAQAAIDTNASRSKTAVDAAMQAEREKEKSETDPLTKLFNRRRLDADLARDAAAVADGAGASFAFVMVDVDHFKSFNDNYGHQKGDEILQGLGVILKESVRGLDTAYRYGGEEFSLILRHMNPPSAYEVVERLRAKVEAVFAATDTPMTASFGVALAPYCAITPEGIIAAADAALYEAKEGGRNRVNLAPPAAPPPTAAPVAQAPSQAPAVPAPTTQPPPAAPQPATAPQAATTPVPPSGPPPT